MLHRRLLLLDSADVGPSRPAMQHPGELRQLVLGTGGINFHAPVIQIAGIPAEPQLHRGPLREVSISHALDAPAHQPPSRRLFLTCHPVSYVGSIRGQATKFRATRPLFPRSSVRGISLPVPELTHYAYVTNGISGQHSTSRTALPPPLLIPLARPPAPPAAAARAVRHEPRRAHRFPPRPLQSLYRRRRPG